MMNKYYSSQTELNHDKVIQFEIEMKNKIKGLKYIEEDINSINQKRKEWLNNIVHTYESDHDTYLKRIEILKLQARLASLQLQQDIQRLEGHSEAQTLSYLVAFTAPYESDETEAQRKLDLHELARRECDNMCELIEQSIQTRLQLSDQNHSIHTALMNIKQEITQQQDHEVEEFNEKISYYNIKMEEIIKKSKLNFTKITEEYLILRHNARVAKEILLRNQLDATKARESLQSCMDEIINEANIQREKLEKTSNKELKFLTEDLRLKVMKKEKEYEELTISYKTLKTKQKKDFHELNILLKLYKSKYIKLNKKRKSDLIMINNEIKDLRSMLLHVESKLSFIGLDPNFKTEDMIENFHKNKDLLLKMRTKLKELQHL